MFSGRLIYIIYENEFASEFGQLDTVIIIGYSNHKIRLFEFTRIGLYEFTRIGL